ncbi:MAG TPA: MtnX-like HAD-IB family phosphatase [bacterium]|nr:MtnX-like HAD-IB family phosphatase [bacterium]
MALKVFCDFDGTITLKDTTDEILSRFAGKEWESVEKDWLDGRFGSEECLRRQMRLVRADKKSIDSLIESIEIDPHFAEFVNLCGERQVPIYVVSDGFEYVINYVLNRGGFGQLEHYANTLIFQRDCVDTAFTNSKPDCDTCATCKVGLMNRLSGPGDTAIVIGDGFSDHYIAECADIVFAKKKLKKHCESNGIGFHPFETFKDVNRKMKEIIQSQEDGFESKGKRKERICSGIGALKAR